MALRFLLDEHHAEVDMLKAEIHRLSNSSPRFASPPGNESILCGPRAPPSVAPPKPLHDDIGLSSESHHDNVGDDGGRLPRTVPRSYLSQCVAEGEGSSSYYGSTTLALIHEALPVQRASTNGFTERRNSKFVRGSNFLLQRWAPVSSVGDYMG